MSLLEQKKQLLMTLVNRAGVDKQTIDRLIEEIKALTAAQEQQGE